MSKTHSINAPQRPRRIKMAIIVWLAIYPLISLALYLFGDKLAQLPVLARTFLLTIVLVPTMTFIVMPFYNRIFSTWLNR